MPLYKIQRSFTFSASHELKGLGPDHPCGRNHGHNYTVEVVLASEELDETGFVLDTTVIGQLKNIVDHRFLNDVMVDDNKKPINPTSENLAKWLGQKLIDLLFRLGEVDKVLLESVEVRETESTKAGWYPLRSLQSLIKLFGWSKTLRICRWLAPSSPSSEWQKTEKSYLLSSAENLLGADP